VISGDFNIHVDDPTNRHAQQFHELLDAFDLRQNVQHPTHRGGQTLDLVISRRDVIPTLVCVDLPVYSDHGLVSCCFPVVSLQRRFEAFRQITE